MAALGLRCCAQAFSSCVEQGLLFVAVHGFLTAVASLVAEYGLQARRLQQLWHVGSVVAVRGVWDVQASVVGARRLGSCGSWTLERRLSSCGAWA